MRKKSNEEQGKAMKSQEDNLRKRAELTIGTYAKSPQELTAVEARALVHELQVHQVELEMQNEELRRAQNELEESQSRYIDLYDFAPVGYFTFNKDGIIKEANLTGALLFGMERRYLAKKPFAVFLAPECKDEFYLHMRKVFQGIEVGMCELRLLPRDGTERHVALEAVLRHSGEDIECRAAVSDITELWQAREVQETSLEEKEMLLREIHHRVKNNLQTVGNLLDLQQKQFTDPYLRSAFEKSRERISVIARVHETLSETRNFGCIDFDSYLKGLVAFLCAMHGRPEINFTVISESLSLPTDQAIPTALIINEVVTNAFKHAFPGGRSGTITIELSAGTDGIITLSISDDGQWLSEGFDPARTPALGTQLVLGLAEQLDGTIEMRREQGTYFKLRFRK